MRLFRRLALAFAAFFRVLFDASYAGRVALKSSEPAPHTPELPALRGVPTDGALQLLGLLQREGRLVDFIMEPLENYSDDEISGAPLRAIHAGLRKALHSHFTFEPVRREPEGTEITVDVDEPDIRVTGSVEGGPPFTGRLAHSGWRVTRIELPELRPGDMSIVAPAEVVAMQEAGG